MCMKHHKRFKKGDDLNVQCTTQNIPGSSCIGAYFFSFSLVRSLLLLLLGMYRDRIRFHICCHSGKFSRSSTGVFFYQILMKRNERTLYRIELLYWCKTISHKLGNMYQNFGIVNFFRRCSDQDLIPGFQISQSKLNLLNYYFTHYCACPWNSCV